MQKYLTMAWDAHIEKKQYNHWEGNKMLGETI